MEALAMLADEGASAEQRESVYAGLEESVVRGSGEEAVALAKAATRAICSHVLCAPMSRIAVDEIRRAGLLLTDMSEQHPIAVCGEASRLTSEGTQLGLSPWLAHGSHEATMLEKTE
jgi:hypothetical protein